MRPGAPPGVPVLHLHTQRRNRICSSAASPLLHRTRAATHAGERLGEQTRAQDRTACPPPASNFSPRSMFIFVWSVLAAGSPARASARALGGLSSSRSWQRGLRQGQGRCAVPGVSAVHSSHPEDRCAARELEVIGWRHALRNAIRRALQNPDRLAAWGGRCEALSSD